jgi:RHS repeat-associated protein
LITNPDGEVVQHVEYVPFGEVFIEERNNTWNTPYLFNAKELDEETGLYYYGARYFDSRVSVWLGCDPMWEKYPNLSTYAYCGNNPVRFIDPTGLTPIYDPDGNFLGTDDQGLTGAQLILNKADFSQGMAHSNAQKVLWTGTMSDEACSLMDSHVAGLSSRPDYDGIVTIAEGIAWAKDHPGALDNPTADNTLYIDASKLNFGFLSTSDFKYEGVSEPQNLFTDKNLAASAIHPYLAGTVYALGAVDMILLDRNEKTVRVVNNSATDYDWNTGGSRKRDLFIKANNALAGINPQVHGFKTYYYGVGKLRK